MALVDAGRSGIDDDEHLCGKVLGAAVEYDAWNVNAVAFAGALPKIEVQGSQAMLAVNNQELGRRILQVSDALLRPEGLEVEPLMGEQQHRAGDRRLVDRHFVEILQGPHLGARELALKGRVAVLDAGNELRDFVALRDHLRRDLLPLAIEAADEAHSGEDVLRRVAHEVEGPVLLADARG